MELLKHILKSAPEAALFASLFLGWALGKVKIKGFCLGGVAGSLVVALVIGQLDVTLPEALKAVCFALFIYAVGFKSRPEFFGGLNRSSFKLVISSVVQCLTALIALRVIARICGFGKGYAAGIGAGAFTATAMMGTAGDALTRLGLSPDQLTLLTSQMAVGFAITYVPCAKAAGRGSQASGARIGRGTVRGRRGDPAGIHHALCAGGRARLRG